MRVDPHAIDALNANHRMGERTVHHKELVGVIMASVGRGLEQNAINDLQEA